MLAKQGYSLFLNGFKELTVMIIQKYSLPSFNEPSVASLFDYINSRYKKSVKVLDLIEKTEGWTNEKRDGDLKVSFKQVGPE